jgi:hypothetical protein
LGLIEAEENVTNFSPFFLLSNERRALRAAKGSRQKRPKEEIKARAAVSSCWSLPTSPLLCAAKGIQ